jgi:hypothetical protein
MADFRLNEEQLRELGRFARSMVLNQRFAVHVVVGEDPELACPAVMVALGRSLESDGRGLELRRLDHEHLDEVVTTLELLLARHAGERVLILVDLSALPRSDEARACDLFSRLNGRRDTLGAGLVGELVFCVPRWLEGPMLAAGPDLASVVRIWLLAREALDLGRLQRWRASCDARFNALVASTASAAERYQHGTYVFSYCFEPGAVSLSLSELHDRLAVVPGHTGWRPWWVPTTKHPPRVHDGALECWMFGGEQLFPDPAHSDFWRASGRGCLHLRRGYDEDSSEAQAPGRVFSNSLAIGRAAEALLHVRDFARELGLAPHHRVAFEACWTGLAGRELSHWPDRPARLLGSSSVEAQASATITFEPAALADPSDLEELVEQLVEPLYERFMTRPTQAFVAQHIQRLLARA